MHYDPCLRCSEWRPWAVFFKWGHVVTRCKCWIVTIHDEHHVSVKCLSLSFKTRIVLIAFYSDYCWSVHTTWSCMSPQTYLKKRLSCFDSFFYLSLKINSIVKLSKSGGAAAWLMVYDMIRLRYPLLRHLLLDGSPLFTHNWAQHKCGLFFFFLQSTSGLLCEERNRKQLFKLKFLSSENLVWVRSENPTCMGIKYDFRGYTDDLQDLVVLYFLSFCILVFHKEFTISNT